MLDQNQNNEAKSSNNTKYPLEETEEPINFEPKSKEKNPKNYGYTAKQSIMYVSNEEDHTPLKFNTLYGDDDENDKNDSNFIYNREDDMYRINSKKFDTFFEDIEDCKETLL